MIVEFEDVRGIIAPGPWSSVDCLDVVDVDDFGFPSSTKMVSLVPF
jgi:hypothetical protein